MAYPSVTNTFVTSTTISSSKVNQNFTDLVNALSDGTKDLNVLDITADNLISLATTTVNSFYCGNTANIVGELKGAREIIVLANGLISMSTSAYYWMQNFPTTTGTNECQVVMNRAGSLVGYGIACFPGTFTSAIVFTPCLMKNGSTMTAATNINISSSATTLIYGTYARNTYTFSAGDTLGIKSISVTSGNVAMRGSAFLEVQFDT